MYILGNIRKRLNASRNALWYSFHRQKNHIKLTMFSVKGKFFNSQFTFIKLIFNFDFYRTMFLMIFSTFLF